MSTLLVGRLRAICPMKEYRETDGWRATVEIFTTNKANLLWLAAVLPVHRVTNPELELRLATRYAYPQLLTMSRVAAELTHLIDIGCEYGS
jgi:hypothetical protein